MAEGCVELDSADRMSVFFAVSSTYKNILPCFVTALLYPLLDIFRHLELAVYHSKIPLFILSPNSLLIESYVYFRL